MSQARDFQTSSPKQHRTIENRERKMSAKLAFILAGALVVAGCNLGSDATVFPYSKDQVQAMLVDAKTTLPRRDGPGDMIKIWGAGRSSKGVKLNMKYASWA